jgi:hypothetical protein
MKDSIFKNAFNNKSLIGIRTHSQEWGKSIIGFIVKLDDYSFTINEIDEYGYYIGHTTIKVEEVINIDIDDRYQRRLKFIHDHISIFNINNRITIWEEGSKLLPYFNELKERKTMITFYLNEDAYLTGSILNYDKNEILINNVGREGDEDGISCHYINDLIGLRYNSLEEQKITLLYENQSQF